MEAAQVVLPIVMYILGSILLVVLIILGIKLIITMNKIESVVDDVDSKVKKLNGLFSIIDVTTDRLSSISDRFIDLVSIAVSKIFKSKKRKENEDEQGKEEK